MTKKIDTKDIDVKTQEDITLWYTKELLESQNVDELESWYFYERGVEIIPDKVL
jgi:hypothetical protein